MLSKKSFFNKSVFRTALVSCWPLWAAYLVAWIIVLPITTAVNYYDIEAPHSLFRDILDISQTGGVIIGGIYGILSVMMVWNFLYKSKTSSGVACLPIKREGVFVSVSLAAITPAIIINIFVFAIAALVHVGRGYSAAISYDAIGFAAATLMLIFFFGLGSLCAQLAGHEGALLGVYLVLNFVAIAVEGLIHVLTNVVVYGMEYGGITVSRYLSPVVAFFDGGSKYHREYSEALGKEVITHVSYEGLGFIAICAAVGILLIFAALALYRRREMESAGDVVAVKVLKPIFKYCLCFGGALVSGLGFYALIIQNLYVRPLAETLLILFFMLIGGFVGFFAGEMLNRKSFRVFRGQWKKLVLSLAIICVAVLGLEFNLLGLESRVPDTEDIEWVQLYASDSVIYKDAENIASIVDIHKNIISEKATNENTHGHGSYFAVEYTLKNGRVFSRAYSLRYYPESTGVGVDTIEAIERVQNSAEAIAFRKGLPFVASAESVAGGHFNGYVTMDEYMALNPNISVEDYIISEYFGYDKYYVVNEMSEGEKQNLLVEYYAYSGDRGALSSRATWDFSDEELWELYSQCIVPDLEEGRIGKLWINEDEDYFSSVCSGKVFIDFVYYSSEAIDSAAPYAQATSSAPRPIALDEGMRSYSFSVVPTVGSRTWQWLENKGVIIHTIGEEYAATDGYTHY